MDIMSSHTSVHRTKILTWMDTLQPEDLDEIIRHPDPTERGTSWPGSDGCGCLVGCVTAGRIRRAGITSEYLHFPSMLLRPGLLNGSEHQLWSEAGGAFPWLTARIGPRKAWAWVKQEAAKRIGGVEVEELGPQAEPVEVA